MLAPELMVPARDMNTAGTQYDLRVNYAFAGGDVVNPKIVVNLPPGVLLMDLGSYTSFTGNCNYENPSGIDAYTDWTCQFTTNRIVVPSGGVTGQIPLRIRVMPFTFADNASVTFTAALTADNITAVNAEDASVIDTSNSFVAQAGNIQGGWARKDMQSPVGPLSVMQTRTGNSLTGYTREGSELRWAMPAGTQYVGMYSSNYWSTTAARWSSAESFVQKTARRLGFAYNSYQGNSPNGNKAYLQVNDDYTYPVFWNDCSYTSAPFSIQLWGSLLTTGDLINIGTGHAGITTNQTHSVLSCTSNLSTSATGGTFPSGQWYSQQFYIFPPAGQVPVWDMYGVMSLPTGLDYQYPQATASSYGTKSPSAPWQLYRCNIPAKANAIFTQAEFDAYRTAGDCVSWQQSDQTVYTGTNTPTHLVAYAPTYVIAEDWGPTVWRQLYLSINFRKSTCAAINETFTFAQYASGRPTENATLQTSTLNSTRTLTAAVGSSHYHDFYSSTTGQQVTTVPKGRPFSIYLQPQSPNGLNGHGKVVLPPGIRVLDVQWYNHYPATCSVPPLLWSRNEDGSIAWSIGNTTNPWYLSYNNSNCALNSCQPSGYGYIRLDAFVDEAYPFSDGQIVTVNSQSSWDNHPNNNPTTGVQYVYPYNRNLTISVPAEMRLRIEPTCSGAPGGANRQLGVLARLSNDGGVPLTGSVSIINIPKEGDGSGTEADTFYSAHSAPAGITVTCGSSASGPWAACTSGATHVRIDAGTLDAYEIVDVEIFMTVPAAPSGTSIYTRGSLDSDLLLPVNAISVAPSKVDLCPGDLQAEVWFDENADGVRDASEPSLPTWIDVNGDGVRNANEAVLALEVTSPDNEEFVFEFEADGTLVTTLPGGTAGNPQVYNYALINPADRDNDAVWRFTTDVAPDIRIAADGTFVLNLPVLCACADTEFCTIDSCNFLGQCVFVPSPPIPDVDDSFCDGIDNNCNNETDEGYEPVPVICGFGACVSEGLSTCDENGEDLELGTCVPNLENATQEVCDADDNDCDGLVDAADPTLELEECEQQEGVCAGSQKLRQMCVQGDNGASWQRCSDGLYAAHAFPYAYVSPGSGNDLCGDPLVGGGGEGGGVDNDCDGEVDEDHEVMTTTCGAGACRDEGQLTCNNGQIIDTCEAAAGGDVEYCNGLDDDCDGQTDEAADLEEQACANQQGVCSGAVKTVCLGLAGWKECGASEYVANDESYSSTDATCDNTDNDCSGQRDEDYVGGSVSCGQGVCAVTGTQVCVGGSVQVRVGTTTTPTCQPNTAASTTETCDTLDNDCDGQTDAADTSLSLIPCDLQGGVCAGSTRPRTLCVAGTWQNCATPVYTAHNAQYSPVDASCDGVDNDCTGGADDDYVATTTVCGEGACQGTVGQLACQNGTQVDTCDADGGGSDELCNGRDDDCDGAFDEDFAVGVSCTTGLSVCESTGKNVCSADGTGVVCDAPVITGSIERCDDIDNDCDGTTDEIFNLGEACTIGLGECRRDGVRVCVEGGTAACDAEVVSGSLEICDGLDNDCNGLSDEGSTCPQLDTIITTGPDETTADTSASFTYEDSVSPDNTEFECQLDGGMWMACDGGAIAYDELTDGPHTFLVRAIGPTGNVDDTPAYWVWTVDTTVPDTTVLSGPQDPAQTSTASFTFGSNVAEPSAWWCALDPEGETIEWFECSQTWTWSDLPDGTHTILVYVVDELGVADPEPAEYTWTIDTKAPETTIISAPSAVICESSATIEYGGAEELEGGSYECRLDDAAWAPCESGSMTYSELADGLHTFEVAVVDDAGNSDPTPARVTFRVDTQAPDTTITIAPFDPSQSATATFAFSSNELGATFTCQVDQGEPGPCTSPFTVTGLADGQHTVTVTANDLGCLSDTSPATHTWTIDTSFPETAFVSTPPFRVGDEADNDFTYEDPTNAELDTFECSLDGAEWAACNGGESELGVLPLGTHTFQVRSCETIVQTRKCDPTPAVYTWEVSDSPCPLDATGPAISCAADFAVECAGGVALVDLELVMATATDACGPVDVSTTANATAPYGVSPLVFQATDGNGNVSSCVTRVTVADSIAPSVTCPEAVDLVTPAETCGVAYTFEGVSANDSCRGTQVSLFSNAPQIFGVGETLVTFTAVDAAGNEGTCTTTVTVVDETPLELTCEATVTQVAPSDACSWSGSLTAEARDNCAVDVTVVERTNIYAVGEQDVEFTAADDSGNGDSCTTRLIVNDETLPVVTCGTITGPVPATVTASATDACGATAVITGFTCYSVDEGGTKTEIADEACPVSFAGAVLTISGRLETGTLEVGYGVEATDPSGNVGLEECVVTFTADADRDGILDEDDNCPVDPNTDQTDADEDGLGDACDICPAVADPDQVDSDDNGIGDLCQDRDADGVLDTTDNCVDVPNATQADTDGDGHADACDVCPTVADVNQLDGDANGIGDLCEDADEDGVYDVEDNCPADPNEDQLDWDGDEIGNPCDEVDAGIAAEGSGGCAGGGEAGFALGLLAMVVVLARRARRTV